MLTGQSEYPALDSPLDDFKNFEFKMDEIEIQKHIREAQKSQSM